MKIKLGKQGWQKRDFIEGILAKLKEEKKTVCDIKYIVKRGSVDYWLTWDILIKKVKIKCYDTIDYIIVGEDWWINRQYEGDCDDAYWYFRTMPKMPEIGYEQYHDE